MGEVLTYAAGERGEAADWRAVRLVGDEQARARLIERYLPLARKLARRYHRSTEPMEDLVQVASYGLLKAVDRYDPDLGRAFTVFAVPTILGELRRYFRDCGWSVHVPRGDQERAMKVRDAGEQLRARTGHAPTVQELAQFLEMDTDHVIEGLLTLQSYAAGSLDEPLRTADDDSLTRHDTLGDVDPNFELAELGASLAEGMQGLEQRERELLGMRFIGEMSQSEIAARMGISQMQVSRLLAKTTTRLRELAG